MKSEIFCGRATDFSYDAVMELLNLSFNFTEPESLFQGLLPKCYREDYRPQDSNYVVVDENGVMAAAVGAYDHELSVCSHILRCRGIGNVAVHPEHRKNGYMKMAMNRALRDMIADGVAISTLGGRRQRYQYFGYDKAGAVYNFSISEANIHHAFSGRKTGFKVREVTDPEDSVIDEIIALNKEHPVYPIRPRGRYLDIANTWHSSLIVAHKDGRFAGYFIIKGKSVSEIQCVNVGDLTDMLLAVYAYVGEGFTVQIPYHQNSYAAQISPVAENASIGTAMHFNVLDYKTVIEAFLQLKQTYTELQDGEAAFLIHGYARDERIRITVCNGEVKTEIIPDCRPVDYELSHLGAMEFIFSPISPLRETSSALMRTWFPLPICMYRADEV